MFKKGKINLYQLLFLFLGMIFIGDSLVAQGISVRLDDTRDCNQNTYCVSIQIQSPNESASIGTSSIFLKYNAAAISYSSYTSSHFDGSDQCIQGQASSWDVQTFDANSAPGFFNVTMTLLTNQFSCPSIEEQPIEVGILCFNVEDEQKSPNLSVAKNNTSFNSNLPNTGEKLHRIATVDHINKKALICSESTINCEQQKELWEQTELELPIISCNELASFCTGISFNNKGAYQLTLNDQVVEEIEKCESGNTTLFYTYSSFLKLEKGGDFEVVSWEVNGTTYKGSFTTTEELIQQLNEWNSEGNWSINTKTNTIIGGIADQNYGPIEIKNSTTGLSIMMALNKKVSDYSTSISLPEGVHQLMATNKFTQCKDEITIIVACDKEAEDRVELKKNTSIQITKDTSFCFSDYITSSDFIEDCTDQEGNFSKLSIDNQTNCIQVLANSTGIDSYCLLICDKDNNCKTLNLTIEILENLRPVLRDDQVAIMMNEPTTIDIIDNDVIKEAIHQIEIPHSRMDGTVTVDEMAQRVMYTPAYNACGIQDSFQYKIITESGESIAAVYIEVLCEELTVFSGFSPNGDDINDYFKIMGIENFEENELVIFNSTGNEVYSKIGYQNEDGWDGTWKGKDLPDGTYFYMLRINNKAKPISGYIQLQR